MRELKQFFDSLFDAKVPIAELRQLYETALPPRIGLLKCVVTRKKPATGLFAAFSSQKVQRFEMNLDEDHNIGTRAMLASTKVMHGIEGPESEGDHFGINLNHQQFDNLNPEDPIQKEMIKKLTISYLRRLKESNNCFEVLSSAKINRSRELLKQHAYIEHIKSDVTQKRVDS